MTGEHQGFREAKENVLQFLGEYIERNEITGDIKVWITGYSRAAATTNLTAAALDRAPNTYLGDTFILKPEDVYAYCFEVPQGAIAEEAQAGETLYGNIHGVVNPNDLVPKVAMNDLGFAAYGERVFIPDKERDELYDAELKLMLEQYNNLTSIKGMKESGNGQYVVDDFQQKKVVIYYDVFEQEWYMGIQDDTYNNWSQNRFLNNYLTVLTRDVMDGSRIVYVEEYQDTVRELCNILFGTVLSDPQKMDAFSYAFAESMASHAMEMQMELQHTGRTSNTIRICCAEALQEAGVSEYDQEQLQEALADVGELLGKMFLLHPQYTTSVICNYKTIVNAHYPELCFAWLRASDPNYTSTPIALNVNGDSRTVSINCPVDIKVYDSDKQLIAAIESDAPVGIPGRSNLASITPDGEKEIALPPNESYTVEILATGDGTMDYSVQEFSYEAGDVVRVVNYYDVPIVAGQILTGYVGQVSEEELQGSTINGTQTEYTLIMQTGEAIEKSLELTGTDAITACYSVAVSVNDSEKGMVLGTGIRQVGSYAKLQAIPYSDAIFEGWYEGEKLLSAESEYRFRVEGDREIEAKFVTRKDEISLPEDETLPKNAPLPEDNVVDTKEPEKVEEPEELPFEETIDTIEEEDKDEEEDEDIVIEMKEKPEQPQIVQPVTGEKVVTPKHSENPSDVKENDKKVEEPDMVQPDVEEKSQNIEKITNEVAGTAEENAKEEVVVLYPYIIAIGLLLLGAVMIAKKRKEENTHEE